MLSTFWYMGYRSDIVLEGRNYSWIFSLRSAICGDQEYEPERKFWRESSPFHSRPSIPLAASLKNIDWKMLTSSYLALLIHPPNKKQSCFYVFLQWDTPWEVFQFVVSGSAVFQQQHTVFFGIFKLRCHLLFNGKNYNFGTISS